MKYIKTYLFKKMATMFTISQMKQYKCNFV